MVVEMLLTQLGKGVLAGLGYVGVGYCKSWKVNEDGYFTIEEFDPKKALVTLLVGSSLGLIYATLEIVGQPLALPVILGYMVQVGLVGFLENVGKAIVRVLKTKLLK